MSHPQDKPLKNARQQVLALIAERRQVILHGGANPIVTNVRVERRRCQQPGCSVCGGPRDASPDAPAVDIPRRY